MDRRRFVASSLVASAAALVQNAQAQANADHPREFYQLRRYTLQTGPQVAMTEKYISEALIPAIAKRGGPVGAFRVDIGPETPTFYVLIPVPAPHAVGTLEVLISRRMLST